MKLKYILGATALSFVLAGTAYPQQEQEKEKPQQQEEKPAEKPKTQQKQQQGEQKQEQKNEQKQEKQSARQQSEQPKQSEQSNRERQDQQKQLTRQQQDEQKQEQRQQQRTEGRDQHSDGGHGRIPEDRFRSSFGREHHFRVEHVDNRRFQYGGYWFTFNEGWPVGWVYADDFYIDFIDGQYYLIDLTHPGVQLLLVVE